MEDAAALCAEVPVREVAVDGVGNRIEKQETRLVEGTSPLLALHSSETVDLDHHSLVQGNVAAAGPQNHALTLGPSSHLTGNAAGQRVRLQQQSRIDGNVSTNALTKHASATIGGSTLPYAAPPPVPGVQPIVPGSVSVTAGPHQTIALPPGSYSAVDLLHHSRLVLTAGTYTLGSLRVGPHGVVEVQGPVLVRVASNLEMDHDVEVIPAAGLTAGDVRWETSDTNVLIGPQGVFVGSVLAPLAEVEVQHHTQFTGWVQAKRVRIGPHAQVMAPQGGGGQPITTTIAYQVNQVNQYTSVGGVARSHDANGNLQDDGLRLFTYDYRNRMVAVSRRVDGAPIASYRFDAFGRRIEKAVYSQSSLGAVDKVTRFFWDAWDLIEEQGAAAVTESTYVGGVAVDEHLQWQRTASHPQGAGTFYLHQDVRGNVVAVTNTAGNLVEKTRYDDFGGADHASSVGLALGFQGRYLDHETGLYEFRHRVYDPSTGRFLQRDPVWDPLNTGNQYSFVGNNPGTFGDPSGLIGGAVKKAKKLLETINDLKEIRRRLKEIKKATAKNKQGGAYGWTPAKGGEVHHMPAKGESPLPERYGPSVRMDVEDHYKTRSHGAASGPMIASDPDSFLAAMDKDILDLRRVAEEIGDPHKYDVGIAQMRQYADLLHKHELLPGQRYSLENVQKLKELKADLLAKGVKVAEVAAIVAVLGAVTANRAEAQDESTVEPSEADTEPSWLEVGWEALTEVVAPTTKEMANNPEASKLDVALGLIWDVAKWADPLVVTDAAEYASGYSQSGEFKGELPPECGGR